jgi:hypothetical protein
MGPLNGGVRQRLWFVLLGFFTTELSRLQEGVLIYGQWLFWFSCPRLEGRFLSSSLFSRPPLLIVEARITKWIAEVGFQMNSSRRSTGDRKCRRIMPANMTFASLRERASWRTRVIKIPKVPERGAFLFSARRRAARSSVTRVICRDMAKARQEASPGSRT